MKLYRSLVIPAVLPLLLSIPRPSAAQSGLTVTLTPATAQFAPGAGVDQTFTFSGTLTNTSAAALYLNGDQPTLDAPLTLDDIAFFNALVFPTDSSGNLLPQPMLDAGQSLTLPLFNVTAPANTAAGTYNGIFEIQGGATPNDFGLLAAPTFTLTGAPGAPVPEASTAVSLGLLLALSLGAVTCQARRRAALS